MGKKTLEQIFNVAVFERAVRRQRTQWASSPQSCIIARRKVMWRQGEEIVREEYRWLKSMREK